MSVDGPSSTSPLWRRARAMFERAQKAVGAPASIAAITDFSTHLRRCVLTWLALMEHVVRKLLFADAARLGAVPGAVLAREGWVNSEDRSPPRAPDPSNPAGWRACFRLAPPRDHNLVPAGCGPRIRSLAPDAPLWRSEACKAVASAAAEASPLAFRLARRLEALRRVLADPAPHARRLARLLHRLRRRHPEIFLRYASAPARTAGYDPEDPRFGLECLSQAYAAEPLFRDTS